MGFLWDVEELTYLINGYKTLFNERATSSLKFAIIYIDGFIVGYLIYLYLIVTTSNF